MKIKPYGNNILVKPVEKRQIMISEKKSLCEYGEVVEIGDSVEKVKVGDIIGYTIWGINKLEINEETHYFIPEDDRFILGVILPEQLPSSFSITRAIRRLFNRSL